jgi:LysR family transcriptional regulator, glycine cleavage system transcriptional activator
MGLRLPPLNALRLFESAGRHLSFKLAAQELGVTPSAVSHGVQGLEDWLGAPLFTRGSRGLALTERGAEYLPVVRDALISLADASERMRSGRAADHIRISVPPTFGSRILLPRLGRFRHRFPGTAVHIDTFQRHVEFHRDGVDLAIRMGKGDWPGLEAELLVAEDIVPVCTPGFKERHEGGKLGADLPLIHVTTAAHDWETWLHTQGCAIDDPRGLRVDTIQMAIDAALRGMGVVIGRRPLVDPELAAGTLVQFVERTVRSPTAYWLVGRRQTMALSHIRAFRDWLFEELAPAGPGPARDGRGTGTLVRNSPATFQG